MCLYSWHFRARVSSPDPPVAATQDPPPARSVAPRSAQPSSRSRSSPRRTGPGAAALRKATGQSHRAPVPSSGSRAGWQKGRRDAPWQTQTRSPLAQARCRSRRACPSAQRQATPDRSGSPEQLTQPHRAGPRCRHRPLDRNARSALADVHPDCTIRRCRRRLRSGSQLQRQESCAPRRQARPRDRPGDRRFRCGFVHPGPQHVRVQLQFQGDGGDRGSRLAACRDGRRPKFRRVPPTSTLLLRLHKCPLKAKWTLSSR